MIIPLLPDDGNEFALLPAPVRDEIAAWLRELPLLEAAPKRSKGNVVTAIATRLGVGGSTVRAKYTEWTNAGKSWRALVNRAKLPRPAESLPPAFVQEVKRRFERQNRSSQAAYRELIRDWRHGVALPGYPVPPPVQVGSSHPAGWSYSHLLKRCKSTAFEKTAMRVGLGAALAKHGPKVYTTRAELWPGSHYMFDDVDHDNFVHIGKQQFRPVELGVLDVLSASRFAWGARPQLRRPDGTTATLNERDMRFFVASVLHQFGYNREQGTELIVEHATAAIRDNIEQILHDRSHGKLTVRRGGFTGKAQAVAGMFLGSGGGNPRTKSALESLHNLIHNELASLPAQTGPDLERRPEALAGLLKHSTDLLKLGEALTPYQRGLLKIPTPEYHTEFLPLLNQVHRLIDHRTDHQLEGWQACGFTADEYRFAATLDQWIGRNEFHSLPGPVQTALTQIVEADPRCRRPVRLSPAAAFARGRAQLVPAPMGMIAEILYADLHRAEKTGNGYFCFSDREIAPEELRYEAHVKTLHGQELALTDRETYDVVVNPFAPELLWVFSGRRGKGAFLGTAQRDVRVGRQDVAGLQRRFARNAARLQSALDPLRARHADLTREAAARDSHNAAVIAGPRSPEEARVLDERASAPVTDLTALLGPDSISGETTEQPINPINPIDTDCIF